MNLACTEKEIRQHNNEKDCWIVIRGKVYDVTKYLTEHPGGEEVILEFAGSDATLQFDDIGHSKDAVKLLEKFEIGVCHDYDNTKKLRSSGAAQKSKEPSFFQQIISWLFKGDERKSVVLTKRVQLTRDTVRLTFETPNQIKMGIQTGQNIVCYDGECQNKYTPVVNKTGEFELIVKVYPNGRLSSHLGNMNVGDDLLISGPVGDKIYLGNGEFSTVNKSIVTNNVLFICAGSGITPIYAILNKMSESDHETIYTKLLFVNRREDDIICRDELDRMTSENKKIYYTLTQPTDDWKGLKGRPSKEMIRAVANGERDETVIICGSREFGENVLNFCLELGYDSERIIVF
jgi:nitrate reductase (NAD(P)H)